MMRATIWGCRGSLAAPGPDTVRYGGNTSCVEVRLADGTLIVLDAGTGVRGLGLALERDLPDTVHLLLTHLHLDHLVGLGFFAPLWSSETKLHVWGPPSPMHSLQERVALYLSPPLFPVRLTDLPSRPVFHDAPAGEWMIGNARVHAAPVSHRGPTVGYRIEEGGRALAYLPDHEPARGGALDGGPPERISGYSVAHGVDVLLHDSQYTQEEYRARPGWGHSSVEHVVEFGRLAGVGRLIMFHHDPLHTDAQLETMHARAVELWGRNSHGPELAHEGMVIELP